MPEAIQANKEPLDKEPPLGASEAILEMSANTPGKTIENPPCLEASYTTVSPEFSYWKLVTKKFLGEATLP